MFCKNCGNKIKDGAKFCAHCGKATTGGNTDTPKDVVKIFTLDLVSYFKNVLPKLKHNRQIVMSWMVLVVMIIIAVLAMKDSSKTISKNINLNDNTKSVVGIWCDNDQGGSRTIFTTDGIVLTNNHVIEGATLCKITIPNSLTGGIEEIYEATPIIVSKLSKKYDVATLKINAAYIDSSGKTWGTYPTNFSSFIIPKTCDVSEPSKLGDSVRVYGYPVTSGGYNLTITDGIISSFSDEGNILTSAQIDSGNSGGLAIDQNGCWLGMPSAVVSGNYQNLGVVIPGNIIQIFLISAPAKLNPSAENTNSVSQLAINPQQTNEQRCQSEFGLNSTWSGEMDKQDSPTCVCQTGYSWDATGKACATEASLKQECRDNFGLGSYSDIDNGKAVCNCSSGYQWNSTMTACVAIPTLTNDQICDQKFNNSYSTPNSDGSNSCSCKSGYYWDNNAIGQDGNCFTPTELNQGCDRSAPGTYWNGKYTSEGIYECAY